MLDTVDDAEAPPRFAAGEEIDLVHHSLMLLRRVSE